jgi:uncharacterized protein (TIRG00374 family)
MRNISRIIALIKRHPMKARLMMVIILFSVLIYFIHPSEILIAFKHARPRYFFYAVLLMVPNLLLQQFKWRFILRDLTPKPSFRTTFVSLLGGFFLGASTPGRTGELARGIFIPGHSRVKIASLTLIDKGFSQLVVYLCGLFALGCAVPWPFSLIPFSVGFVVIVIASNIHRLRPFLEKFFIRFTHSERVKNALAAFDALSVRTVMGMIAFSIPFYITFTCQFYCMILCFTDLNVIDGIKTVPVIFFLNSMFPVAIGDLGVKEFMAVNVLRTFGIAGGAAFSASLIQNVLTFIVHSLAGGVVFIFLKPQRKQEVSASDDHTALSLE